MIEKQCWVHLNFCVVYRMLFLGLENMILIKQQDASEIMSCMGKELCVKSPNAKDMLRATLKNQVHASIALQFHRMRSQPQHSICQ